LKKPSILQGAEYTVGLPREIKKKAVNWVFQIPWEGKKKIQKVVPKEIELRPISPGGTKGKKGVVRSYKRGVDPLQRRTPRTTNPLAGKGEGKFSRDSSPKE